MNRIIYWHGDDLVWIDCRIEFARVTDRGIDSFCLGMNYNSSEIARVRGRFSYPLHVMSWYDRHFYLSYRERASSLSIYLSFYMSISVPVCLKFFRDICCVPLLQCVLQSTAGLFGWLLERVGLWVLVYTGLASCNSWLYCQNWWVRDSVINDAVFWLICWCCIDNIQWQWCTLAPEVVEMLLTLS